MEFTIGIPEYTRGDGEDGETRGRTNGCTMVDIRTDPIIHDLFIYVSMGMNVSTKRKDNKMVMGHNKHNNQKWNITRSPEFGSEISLRTENNRTTRRHFLMRRVKTNEEHNKKGSLEVNGVRSSTWSTI